MLAPNETRRQNRQVETTAILSQLQPSVTPPPEPAILAPAPSLVNGPASPPACPPAPNGAIASVSEQAGAAPNLKQARRQRAALPSPARPASGRELARAERIALAFVIEAGNADLPPAISRLIQFAPESFADQRHGVIAAFIRAMREQGQPVHVESVAMKSGQALFISTELVGSILPRDLAEMEAASVLAAFEVRRAQSVFDDAAIALRSSPAQAKTIMAVAIRSLNNLAADAEPLT